MLYAVSCMHSQRKRGWLCHSFSSSQDEKAWYYRIRDRLMKARTTLIHALRGRRDAAGETRAKHGRPDPIFSFFCCKRQHTWKEAHLEQENARLKKLVRELTRE